MSHGYNGANKSPAMLLDDAKDLAEHGLAVHEAASRENNYYMRQIAILYMQQAVRIALIAQLMECEALPNDWEINRGISFGELKEQAERHLGMSDPGNNLRKWNNTRNVIAHPAPGGQLSGLEAEVAGDQLSEFLRKHWEKLFNEPGAYTQQADVPDAPATPDEQAPPPQPARASLKPRGPKPKMTPNSAYPQEVHSENPPDPAIKGPGGCLAILAMIAVIVLVCVLQ